jgi:acetyl-CoA carboxylase biotin carboxyl carrier protein
MASLKIDESLFDKLAEILKKYNLSEVEYGDGDIKIRLASHGSFKRIETAEETLVSVQDTPEKISPQKEETIDFPSHSGAVKSPMVGTCYLAPEPGAKNFVSLGDTIQEGQPLLIIEAMKVMNMIKAPKSGKIIHIAIMNADPIEFGQLLVVIE